MLHRFKVMKPASEFHIDPAVRLEDGRVVRTLADAIALLREHETRPGVDDRDEILHQIERATSDQERARAVARFRDWASTDRS